MVSGVLELKPQDSCHSKGRIGLLAAPSEGKFPEHIVLQGSTSSRSIPSLLALPFFFKFREFDAIFRKGASNNCPYEYRIDIEDGSNKHV